VPAVNKAAAAIEAKKTALIFATFEGKRTHPLFCQSGRQEFPATTSLTYRAAFISQ
jgi:hypothetical protein